MINRENALEYYIEMLYAKQNTFCKTEQKYLFSRKQYYKLLKPVLTVIEQNKDATLEELRDILRSQSGIEEKIYHFVKEKQMTSGLVLTGATANYQETFVIGKKKEVSCNSEKKIVSDKEQMKQDSIFDLASVSKLFTGLAILKLVEEETIFLEDKITKYAPQFKNLENVRIMDLLGFKVPVKTDKRVDSATSKEEAEQILFTIHLDTESPNKDNHIPYTDMGAMVLRYVVEGATGMSMKDFLEEYVLEPMGLKNTFVNVPSKLLKNVVSTNCDTILTKDGQYITHIDNTEGIVYDPKAKSMGHQDGVFPGHAGIFSTSKDMMKLASALTSGEYLKRSTLMEMAKNRSGRILTFPLEGEPKFSQYLGYMCYSKNPNLKQSEVHPALSGISFAAAGWTGTQLTVDPANNISIFLGGNRAHNRVSMVDSSRRSEILHDSMGRRYVILPDKTEKTVSYQFATERDTDLIHPMVCLMLQYKLLEDIFKITEKKEKKVYHLEKKKKN